MKLPVPLSFEWNKGNIDKNWQKHKVHYKEAEEVFQNDQLQIFPDLKHSEKEKRFVAFGLTNSKRKLSVFFTVRDAQIRVISVRDQSRRERKVYEKEKQKYKPKK